ncbi:MAG: heavy-metal-associated domain-containing protein [Candidatus Cryptobacteroides sp.]
MKKSILIIAAACAFMFSCIESLAAEVPVSGTIAMQQSKKTASKSVTFNVTMHCEKCVKKINENVAFEKGVKDLSVSLDKKTVTVTYDPAKTDVARLKAAIEKLGYKVTVKE